MRSHFDSSDYRTADRWVVPKHECPFCGEIQEDDFGVIEWICKECGNTYELFPLRSNIVVDEECLLKKFGKEE